MSSDDLRNAPRVNTPNVPFAPRPRPEQAAHVIRSDEEAIEVARGLSRKFAAEAALRDKAGILPLAELDEYSQSGLWGITVPKAYGGAGVSYATLAEVIRLVAEGDSSIAQITQNHLAATMRSSTARSSTRPARCSRISCRSSRSTTKAAAGSHSPTAMRPA